MRGLVLLGGVRDSEMAIDESDGRLATEVGEIGMGTEHGEELAAHSELYSKEGRYPEELLTEVVSDTTRGIESVFEGK